MKTYDTYKLVGVVAALLLMLASCSSDEVGGLPDAPGSNTFSVRVSVQTGHDGTRAPGDPGYDTMLPAPRYLYLWAIVRYESDASDKRHYRYLAIDTQADQWKWTPDSDYPDHRYVLDDLIVFDCGDNRLAPRSKIYIYAIASRVSLDNALSNHSSLSSYLNESGEISWTDGQSLAGYPFSSLAINNIPTSLSAGTVTAKQRSDALRDLYGTPVHQVADNQLSVDANGIVDSPGGTIRLYHCAARVDVTWEVAAYDDAGNVDYDKTLDLQSTTALEGILLQGLPTSLKVFQPTQNVATGGTYEVALAHSTVDAVSKITPGNQWIGRAVAYVTQPYTSGYRTDGKIGYQVSFSNPSGGTPKAEVATTTPSATNTTYTTWYRVNARIKE